MQRDLSRADTSGTIGRSIAATVARVRQACEKRRWGRIRTSVLPCNLGRVLDISAGGLRVISRKPLEGTVEVLLGEPQHRVALQAKVAWQRQVSRREFESGLYFGEIAPDVRARLMKLSLLSAKAAGD